jgi:hypothetical protein
MKINLEIEKINLKKLEIKNNIINNSNNTTNNNINNTINNTTNNNINIVAYGKEDMSFITEKQILDILSNGRKGIYKLIEIVNFNKDKPENHNIRYNNKKDEIVHINNGKNGDFINMDLVIII